MTAATLPSLRPRGPTLSPAEHLAQDDLDGVMRVEGFRDVPTWLRPAGWSKQCQDWPLQKAWAHQFHPSWLAGLPPLLQARVAPNQRPAPRPRPPGSPAAGFRGLRAGAVPGAREALNYTLVEGPLRGGVDLGKTFCHRRLHKSVFLLSAASPSGSQLFVNLNKCESCPLKSLAASRVHFPSNLATSVLQILTAEAVGGLPSVCGYSESHIPPVKCPVSTLAFHQRASS